MRGPIIFFRGSTPLIIFTLHPPPPKKIVKPKKKMHNTYFEELINDVTVYNGWIPMNLSV